MLSWRLIKIEIIIFTTVVFSGCSSVFQMPPPDPLPIHGYRSSLILGFNISRMVLPSIGANFYWGVGKNCNLGLGFQPPFGISHITAVKYLNSDKLNYENLYASLNGILFNFDNSPNFELGASYLAKSGRSFHSFSAGLWITVDNDATAPLWRILFGHPAPRARFNPVGYPFIKYEFSNRDLSFSIRNEFGLTKHNVKSERRRLDQNEKIVIPNSDIAFVTVGVSDQIQIKLNDGTNYRIIRDYPGVDAWFPDMEILLLKRYGSTDSIDYYHVIMYQPVSNQSRNLQMEKHEIYELNFDSIWQDYADKKDIVFGSYPERTKAILNQIHWYKDDWSIAMGVKTSR
jgi:hypothetical protein